MHKKEQLTHAQIQAEKEKQQKQQQQLFVTGNSE